MTVQGFFGALLMGVGALMAGLCGLCTVVFMVGGLFGGGGAGELFSGGGIAVLALFLGGLPTVLGVGLFVGGRALWRSAHPPQADVAAFGDPPADPK